jgi:hypothetical protein
MPWYQCRVMQTGPTSATDVLLQLTETEGAFTGRWHKAAPDMQREMLATALTAVSTGLPVAVNLESDAADSIIHNIYLKHHAGVV